MSRSHSQSPTLRERHRGDEEDRASLASGRSRTDSVMNVMLDQLNARHSKFMQHLPDIQSPVGSLRSDVQSQVGSMQSQVGAFQLSLQSQVGEVMSRLERLETSPTPEFAVGQDSNPDCSVGAAVAAHTVAA